MPKRTDLTPTKYPGIYATAGGHVVRARKRDPRTGREVDRPRFVPGSLREALRAKGELEAEIRDRGVVKRTRLRAYATSWLARKLPALSIATGERYRVALEEHILPTFGEWFVDAITPDALVTWRDERAAATYVVSRAKQKPGEEAAAVRRPYEARTVNGFVRIMRTLLADAAVELRLGPSPASRLHALPERKLYGDEDPNVLRGHELGAFLTALREQSPGFYPLVVVMALTGLRTSEATALRWGDLEGDILVVQRSAVRGHIRERTKTDVARRVPLAPVLVEVLREQRARLEEDARALSRRRGEIVQPSPWMFPSRTGQPRYGTTLAKPIKRALRAAEIALRFTPHGLRRTLNDLLRGVATADVQKAITGHSTEAMREHYAHVRVEARAEALGAVAAVVPLRRSQP